MIVLFEASVIFNSTVDPPALNKTVDPQFKVDTPASIVNILLDAVAVPYLRQRLMDSRSKLNPTS